MVNPPPLPSFLLQRDRHSYTDTSTHICWATDTQTHKATYLEEPQKAKIQDSYKKFVFIELMCSFALWLVKQTVFIISNQLSVPVLLFNITGMQSKYWPDWYEGTLMGCHFFRFQLPDIFWQTGCLSFYVPWIAGDVMALSCRWLTLTMKTWMQRTFRYCGKAGLKWGNLFP